MKKVTALLLAVMMLLVCASCGEKEPEVLSTIQATYSVKSLEGEFIVEVQNLGGVYAELYDPDGIYITFKNGEEIYDAEGNAISRDELVVGDTLEIHYNGKLKDKKPKTIEAYKIVKIA